MDGVDVVLDTATAVIDATGLIVTPGGIDTHVHWLSPQVCDAALAGGLTTLVIQDFGPVWNLGCNPPEGSRRRGRRSRRTRSTPRCSCAPPRRGPSRSSTRCAPAARA